MSIKMGGNSTNTLLFIDVDQPGSVATVKEERTSSPEVPKQQQKVIHCVECKFTCIANDKMTRHIRRIHRGLKSFQCSVCEYSTNNSVMYKEHMNIHQGIKPYQCSFCPYRSVSKKYIKMHETRHGTCVCGFQAKNRHDLKRHCKESNCCKEITGKYSCASCNVSYDSPVLYKDHLKRHKQCSYCNESFMPSVLKKHMDIFHGTQTQPEIGKFQCKLCPYKASFLRKILLHLIHHPDQEVSESIDITPLVKAGILVGHAKDGPNE